MGCDWIGIDISSFAIELIQEHRMKGVSIEVRGIPEDMDGAKKLAKEKPFDFETWAIFRIPGLVPNKQQVRDGGIDGRGTLVNEPDNYNSKLTLAQVKGGNFNTNYLQAFLNVIDRDRAAMGVYITLDPVGSPGAHTEAMQKGKIRYGVSEYPRAQLWSIHDYFNGTQPAIPPMNDPYTGKQIEPSLF